MARKPKNSDGADIQPEPAVIKTVKGFNRDLTCRGFQFEQGKTYSVEGPIVACENGFHACEYPLDVLNYYPPASSRFHEVEQGGEIGRHGGDTKIASSTITIGVELSIGDIVARAVKWVFERAKPEGEGSSATGVRGAASATGVRGAASATGYRGAASATGVRGVALAAGFASRAMASETGAICVVCRDTNGNIVAIRASKVGENGIVAGKFYSLNEAGEFIEEGDSHA